MSFATPSNYSATCRRLFYFTSFICPLSVNTEYIKQCGGDGMVDRKVILTAYKKGLKLLFLYLKKHSLNLKDV